MTGWFSAIAAAQHDTYTYTTPSGGVVEVTEVTPTDRQNSKWPDVVCVGEVVRFVRGNRNPNATRRERS